MCAECIAKQSKEKKEEKKNKKSHRNRVVSQHYFSALNESLFRAERGLIGDYAAGHRKDEKAVSDGQDLAAHPGMDHLMKRLILNISDQMAFVGSNCKSDGHEKWDESFNKIRMGTDVNPGRFANQNI